MRKNIRHLLSVGDLSSAEIEKILKRAQVYKKKRFKSSLSLRHHIIGLLFQKASTRTRVSFEVGIREMGGAGIFFDQNSLQMGRGESLLDTLRVMERYLSGMIIRTHNDHNLREASQGISIPVINGLSEFHHPPQAMADALTIREQVKKVKPRIAYLGEGNNITISLIEICSRLRWPLTVASPRGYACPSTLIKNIVWDEKYITLSEDPQEAVRGADVVYTDTWFSMGDNPKDKENAAKKKALIPYQVNNRLLDLASPKYIFLHCLPAYRGQEVIEAVIDGPHSRVWEQAENRLHAQKALMEFFFLRQFHKNLL